MENGTTKDPTSLLEAWSNHFESLAKSRILECEELQELQEQVNVRVCQSLENEEYILDVPFSFEEVENAVRRLKKKTAQGPNNLMGEHLFAGGRSVIL